MAYFLRRGPFLVLCAAGIVGRLVLTATTFGTNDANFWSGWVSMVRELGIVKTYSVTAMINHPPPSLAAAAGIAALARRLDVAFVDLFRVVQIAADVLMAFALFRIGQRRSVEWGRALALFVLLSPAAAFVSAFHCNNDPTMIALVALAASFIGPSRKAALAAGVTLALAASVKIVPFLFVPLFFVALARPFRLWFAGSFMAVIGAGFLPAIVQGGPLIVRRIFGYAGGLPYEWGITGLAFGLGQTFPPLQTAASKIFNAYYAWGRYAVYAALIAAMLFVIRRREWDSGALMHAIAIVVMVMLVMAPGFGVQYIAWLIPLLPFALPFRRSIAVNAAASLFLFVTYTVWNGGWPWWYASVARVGPYRFLAAVAGLAMWFVVCFALVEAVRRFRSEPPARREG